MNSDSKNKGESTGIPGDAKPMQRPPTCHEFPRIDRSDVSSTVLSDFGLKLEHQV